jgi:predicted N-formylglutamate amidohydrolase
MSRGADWPAPVEVVNEEGGASSVLICEHASNHMPAEYRDLGLVGAERESHIARDIGAAAVTRALALAIDAPAFLGPYSRLLIDLNRPAGARSSIPERSEATDVRGNRNLTATERERRRQAIFAPFHARIRDHLDRRASARRPTHIVAVHSFTPVFLGVSRPWHAGVLYGAARSFGRSILDVMSADPSLMVGANVPYVVDRSEDYTAPTHGDDRGVPAILIEIRNDLIRAPRGISEWAQRLAMALRDATPKAGD